MGFVSHWLAAACVSGAAVVFFKKWKNYKMELCECGCGDQVSKKGNRFILGHNFRGKKFSPGHRNAILSALTGIPHTPEHCKAVSRSKMGEKNGNWRGGISFGKYCPKFNGKLKRQIRDKYDNCDYISGLPADICNSHRKLDVHHIDYNKRQGCDDHEWRLIPLSVKNHMRTNTNRPFWNRLFTYALQYDETYYEVV